MKTIRKIAVVGMGYVGLTVANAFAKNQPVLGFDISQSRIDELKRGYDKNNEISEQDLKNPNFTYTTNVNDLLDCDFMIVTVLTPIGADRRPNLNILLKATEMTGGQLKKGDIVVFESTIFPGGTENRCIPVLEKSSGLKCGKDFGVGYSPERINPGDKEHTIYDIPKIVSANDEATLIIVAEVYQTIVKEVYPVPKIAIAEAAKVVENTQRDMNISIMNEIALLLHKLGVDSDDVFKAAGTKWNFLPFKPGLVGGHCIGTNTYYLTNRAEELGFYPDLLNAGRKVNEFMPLYIASSTVKELIKNDLKVKDAKVGLLGLTYKRDTPDLHDTKAVAIMKELQAYEIEVYLYDSIADPKEVKTIFGQEMTPLEKFIGMDAIILLNPHRAYDPTAARLLKNLLKPNGVIIDVNNLVDPGDFSDTELTVWRL